MKLAEVKATLSEVVSRVHTQHERVTITVHGEPAAVLIAPEDLEALEETIAILTDNETVARLISSDAELARGEIVTDDELAEAMANRR
ncbi:type II toxin-antitoxin system Phd/YefM family antitoxin [Nocardia takedensis]|uniref:type II toxin-antitoxin system Phd/YefM family antitoxin n=1 Tax=Nocardia takedensis TaxID=259390 RepID=UPI0002EEEB26|nr:type II toxin-antitoxin system Phd/YefM family antitoxin [Nocardia takedensis]